MKSFLKHLFVTLIALFSFISAGDTNIMNSEYWDNPSLRIRYFISNDQLSLAVAENGQFTLGAEKGALFLEDIERMDMLFGHPNNFGIDKIGSSYTTIVKERE